MRVLVIEDDEDLAQYVCNGFTEHGYQTAWCKDPDQAWERAHTEAWDLVIMDRMLPKSVDGLSIIKKMRAFGLDTPVLILSALVSIDERVQGLREGGDDYLAKPFAIQELLARCEALLRRSRNGEDKKELCIADLRLDLAARRADRSGHTISLQPREFRLLEYLVRHQGQAVTRTMLLESVWDYHFDPQTNVIDVQISRLRNKLDKNFSPPLLHTVRGVGYMISIEAP